MWNKLIIAATGILLWVPAVQAQPPAPDTDAPSTPHFVTFDRVGDDSALNMSLSYASFDGEGTDFNARLDLHGRYMSPMGVGGYLNFPLSLIDFDDQREFALGNLELGGLYALNTPASQIILRGGLVLPTADEEDAYINIMTGLGRFSDYITAIPETTVLRLSGSLTHHMRDVFLRADVGLDVPVDSAREEQLDPFVRLDLGVGLHTSSVTLTAEFAIVGTTESNEDNRFISNIAFAVNGRSASIQPYAAFVVPLEDEFSDVIDFVVIAGVQAPLGR